MEVGKYQKKFRSIFGGSWVTHANKQSALSSFFSMTNFSHAAFHASYPRPLTSHSSANCIAMRPCKSALWNQSESRTLSFSFRIRHSLSLAGRNRFESRCELFPVSDAYLIELEVGSRRLSAEVQAINSTFESSIAEPLFARLEMKVFLAIQG